MHRDIVLMQPVARHDIFRRKADDLSELSDRFVLGDRGDRHLVSARNALARGHAGGGHALPDLIDGNNDIVFG